MRGHGGKAGVHGSPFALIDLVYGSLHVVVDAAPRNAAQGAEGSRMGIEQHFMALGGIGLHYECTAGAKLQMGCQNLAPDAANH